MEWTTAEAFRSVNYRSKSVYRIDTKMPLRSPICSLSIFFLFAFVRLLRSERKIPFIGLTLEIAGLRQKKPSVEKVPIDSCAEKKRLWLGNFLRAQACCFYRAIIFHQSDLPLITIARCSHLSARNTSKPRWKSFAFDSLWMTFV